MFWKTKKWNGVIHDYQTTCPELILTCQGYFNGEGVGTIYIPIKYCPECGRKLSKAERNGGRVRDICFSIQKGTKIKEMSKNLKFDSEQAFIEYIQSGKDLYSPSLELYLFAYNEDGAICAYTVTEEKAQELNKQEEYWGAYLGAGGNIYDNVKGSFENEYKVDDWIDVTK